MNGSTHNDVDLDPDDVEFVTEFIPLRGGETLSLLQCGSVKRGAIVNHTIDRTGLFVWPGARAFVQLLVLLREAEEVEHDLTKAVSSAAAVCGRNVDFPNFGLRRHIRGLLELGGGVGLGALGSAMLWQSNTTKTTLDSGGNDEEAMGEHWENWTTDVWEPALQLALLQKQSLAKERRRNPQSSSSFNVAHLDWLLFSGNTGSSSSSNTRDDDDDVEANMEKLKHHEQRDWDKTFACRSDFVTFMLSGCCDSPPPPLHRPLWLVGLDIIYPDTRDHILAALMRCTRACLEARLQHHCFGSDNERSHFFQKMSLNSFTERDAGRTLRRILVAATRAGITVTPLASPFARGDDVSRSSSSGGDVKSHVTAVVAAAARRILSWSSMAETKREGLRCGLSEAGERRMRHDCWLSLNRDVADALQLRTPSSFATKAAAGGTWFLIFSCAPRDLPLGSEDGLRGDDTEEAASLTPEAAAAIVATGSNRHWLAALPWIWPSSTVTGDSLIRIAQRCRLIAATANDDADHRGAEFDMTFSYSATTAENNFSNDDGDSNEFLRMFIGSPESSDDDRVDDG